MQMLHRFGYYKVATATPVIKVADVPYNTHQILSLIEKAEQIGDISLLAFPELCICGSTCEDLFFQRSLQNACHDALVDIAEQTQHIPFPIILGSPIRFENRLYNCGIVIIRGQIKAMIPKQLLTAEERKYFSILHTDENNYIDLQKGISSYFENHISFYNEDTPNFTFTIEMGEDRKGFASASAVSCFSSANIVVNPCALPARIGQLQKTEHDLQALSEKNCLIYLHVNAGYGESTTHAAFAGQSYIFEAGKKIAAATPFSLNDQLTVGLVDLDKIEDLKTRNNTLLSQISQETELKQKYINKSAHWYCQYSQDKAAYDYLIDAEHLSSQEEDSSAPNSASDKPLVPTVSAFPFIPKDAYHLASHCEEITEIVCQSLIKRLEHIHSSKVIIGISGGLDSTLALLFLIEAFRKMNYPVTDIVGVRMPGFGTSGTTYENSCKLMKLLGITEREVDIKASVIQHLKDISHSLEQADTTYENAQARERTQILMDIANQVGGIVIGTGDLSELALGFCTYNGDHMSMYAVNASIPKTLIPYVIRFLGRNYENPELLSILESIIDTPISPELLPPNANHQILQKTEELIGPYALHDFFLYYMLRYGFSPSKIRALAEQAFSGIYPPEEIVKWQTVFYRRFFSQQFKRNCLPDGPVLGSISLFHTFRMPSDAVAGLWLKELE